MTTTSVDTINDLVFSVQTLHNSRYHSFFLMCVNRDKRQQHFIQKQTEIVATVNKELSAPMFSVKEHYSKLHMS